MGRNADFPIQTAERLSQIPLIFLFVRDSLRLGFALGLHHALPAHIVSALGRCILPVFAKFLHSDGLTAQRTSDCSRPQHGGPWNRRIEIGIMLTCQEYNQDAEIKKSRSTAYRVYLKYHALCKPARQEAASPEPHCDVSLCALGTAQPVTT